MKEKGIAVKGEGDEGKRRRYRGRRTQVRIGVESEMMEEKDT